MMTDDEARIAGDKLRLTDLYGTKFEGDARPWPGALDEFRDGKGADDDGK